MIDELLGAGTGFMPHGYCLRWDPWLLARYVISDAVIGLSYYSIPLMLLHFSRQHPELRFNLVFALFAAFIFACGTTHFIEILNIWWPAYQLQSAMKVATAVISVATAAALFVLAPRMSTELSRYIDGRTRTEDLNRELTAANRALAHSENLFRLTFVSAPIGMAIVGLDGAFKSVNRALCEIVGYSEPDLLKLSFQDITHPEDLELDLNNVSDLIAGRGDTYRMRKRYFRKDAEEVTVQLDVTILRDAEGHPIHFISQIQDISEQVAENRLLEVRATTDDLTGLPNRRAFFDEGRRLISRAQRQNHSVGLVMLDLDHFKSINDTYGHASGDRVLCAIREVVQPRLREGDLLARLGGEEFAVLLPDATPDYARMIAERIRQSIADASIYALDGRQMQITASLGLVNVRERERVESALDRADQAQYRAKGAGRNCVVEDFLTDEPADAEVSPA